MMTILDAIRNEIKAHVWYLQLCKVKDIDVDARTCTCEPVNGDSDILEVRLQSDMNSDKGFVLIPKVNSFVYVGYFNRHSGMVIMTGEIDKIQVDIQNTSLVIDSQGVVINGGNNKGMVKVDSMTDWMNKVYADMITIQGLLSGISLAFTPQTGVALSSNFENTKVKH